MQPTCHRQMADSGGCGGFPREASSAPQASGCIHVTILPETTQA